MQATDLKSRSSQMDFASTTGADDGHSMSRMGIFDLEAGYLTAREQVVYGWPRVAHRVRANQ